MLELYLLLAYLGMMFVPMGVMMVLEHYSSGIIEQRHHMAILRLLSGQKRKILTLRRKHWQFD